MRNVTFDFDLAVLGAGPAGAACALRAARQGLSVLLCDPQSGAFDKPCGEGLMPAGVAVLRDLGISGASARAFSGLRHCVPGAGALEIPLHAAGESWWRTDLHAALHAAIAAQPGIEFVAARAESERREGGAGFRIRAAGAEHTARALVLATGAGARSRPALANARRRRIGARMRFEERRALDRVEVHFGRGCDVYLTPLPRGAVNVVVLRDVAEGAAPDAATLIADGVTAHPAVKDYLGDPVSRAESRTLGGAQRMRRERCGAFHVGDAGGAVDPILGAGLTIALRTGVQAADAATAMAHGAPAAAVARRFASASARERRARRALASGLRFLSRHDLMARCSMRALRRAPALAAGLAGIAAGAPWPAAGLGIPSIPSLL